MKAVIIEDEKQAVIALQQELNNECPTIEICGNAATIAAAIDLIKNKKPELVFLDIQLKDGTGFELLERIKSYDFKVIFTTAYSEYALRAIKISALDYLLKPIDGDELVHAVQKARKAGKSDVLLKNMVYNSTAQALHKKIALQTSKGIFLYELDSIIRLQAESNYTALYLKNQRKLIVAKTLKEFNHLLESNGFLRIHHSHIINLNHLKGYHNKDGGYVVMTDKQVLPVSKRKKNDLLSFLHILGLN